MRAALRAGLGRNLRIMFPMVADVEEIRKARGKVLVKKTAIGTMGWMAQFSTPDGCYLSLWQSAPPAAEPQETTPVV